MKWKLFFIVFEGLSFGEKIKFDKKLRAQDLISKPPELINRTLCFQVQKKGKDNGIND